MLCTHLGSHRHCCRKYSAWSLNFLVLENLTSGLSLKGEDIGE